MYTLRKLLMNYQPFVILSFTALLIGLLARGMTHVAHAQPLPPPGAGYVDFFYGLNAGPKSNTPTESKPESKLWWNDGFWWASMYNATATQYHLYRLNWGSQIWEDTGVPIDDRQESRADVLWDASNKKLYIASHFALLNPSNVNSPVNWARLYRYSYDATTQTYSLDTGFPVNINKDKTEALTLAKDSTGRLWITYVSRTIQADPTFYKVYVNATTVTTPNPLDSDTNWGVPLALPDLGGAFMKEGRTIFEDLSAVIAFKDNGGNKVGIMWSTQVTPTVNISATNHINFAWHLDSNASYTKGADWTLQIGLNQPPITTPASKANDHISLRALQTGNTGQVFAAIKFDNQLLNPPQPGYPEIGLLTREVDGTFSYHTYSQVSDNDSRPIVMIDEGDTTNPNDNQVYVFVSGEPQGSKICYKSLPIPAPPTPLSTMPSFAPGNCGTSFIVDASGVYTTFRDPSSTKQNVNKTTGLVVLAADVNHGYYGHNVIGNPPPVVTARGPGRNAAAVAATAVVTVTFSKPISFPTTVNNTTFLMSDGISPVLGAFTYNNSNRTVTFKPTNPLKANTTYTVKLTNGIKDITNLLLDAFKSTTPNTVVEQWSFSTGGTTAQFAQSSYSVLENGGSAIITVTLAAASAQTVSVHYATSNGTATAPADYTATSGDLTFNPGQTGQAFVVPILDNNVQNPNKIVNLALSNPNGVGLGTPFTATLIIIDNEGPPTVQFSPTSYSVKENDPTGKILLNVSLNHATNTAITVHYTTSDGTAIGGQDYTAVTNDLTFNPNETQKTIEVPLVNDNVHEADETFNATLSNPTGGASIGALGGTATVTIKDDDPVPAVLFSSTTYTIAEGNIANVTVNLSNPSAFPVTVNYATSDGTAKTPADYVANNGTLTFAPGETSKNFTLKTVDDMLSEDNGTVNLTLSNATNATVSSQDNGAALIIVDSDPLPSIQFSAPTYSVVENGVKVTIPVQLSTPSGRGVQVHYGTSDGSANAGTDYVPVDDNLIIPPGQTNATFDVLIINDNVPEPLKTVNLTLDTPVNAMLGATNKATLTIIDDDAPPTVRFSSAAYTITEGAGTATITVTLTAAAASAVTVNYATSDGTATAGHDYTAASSSLTFAPGEFSKTFSIPIIKDNIHDLNKTVNLALSKPVNATLSTPASGLLTIIDDNPLPAGSQIYLPLIRR